MNEIIIPKIKNKKEEWRNTVLKLYYLHKNIVSYYGTNRVDLRINNLSIEDKALINIDSYFHEVQSKTNSNKSNDFEIEIIIFFPKLTIKIAEHPDRGSHNIYNTFAKISFVYDVGEIFSLTRSLLSEEEFSKGYFHSHTSTSDKKGDKYKQFCQGKNNFQKTLKAIHNTIFDNKNLDEELLNIVNLSTIFCFELQKTLEVESKEGIPYLSFLDISRNNNLSFKQYFLNTEDDLKKWNDRNNSTKINIPISILEFTDLEKLKKIIKIQIDKEDNYTYINLVYDFYKVASLLSIEELYIEVKDLLELNNSYLFENFYYINKDFDVKNPYKNTFYSRTELPFLKPLNKNKPSTKSLEREEEKKYLNLKNTGNIIIFKNKNILQKTYKEIVKTKKENKENYKELSKKYVRILHPEIIISIMETIRKSFIKDLNLKLLPNKKMNL